MSAGWLKRLVDGLLFDSLPTPRPVSMPVVVDPAAAFTEVLAAATPVAQSRAVGAVERLKFVHDPVGRCCTPTIDQVRDLVRPFARKLGSARVPSVSRLAWSAVEPLLVDDPAPPSPLVARRWLPVVWSLVLDRAGARVEQLANRLNDLTRGGAEPLDEGVRSALAREASHLAQETVAHIPAEELARALNDQGVPMDGRPILDRLRAAFAAALELNGDVDKLRIAVDRVAGEEGWRERSDLIYDLHGEYAKMLERIGRKLGPRGLDAAGAVGVLVARAATQPWPLLEALRRRTQLMVKGFAAPLDTHAPSDVQMLVNYLVAEAERRGRAALDACQPVSSTGSAPAVVVRAATLIQPATVWLHGLLGSGFLDSRGSRYSRVANIRDGLSTKVSYAVLPALRNLVLAPFSRLSGGQAAEADPGGRRDGVNAACAAARELSVLRRLPDGLRSHSHIVLTIEEGLRALTLASDTLIGRSGPPDTGLAGALIDVVAELDGALADVMRRRFAAAVAAAAGSAAGPAGQPRWSYR